MGTPSKHADRAPLRLPAPLALILLVWCQTLGVTPGAAQTPPPQKADSGRTRVRITAPELHLNQAAGWARDTVGDTLHVSLDFPRTTVAIPRSKVTQMDVSVGRERHILRKFGLGIGIGAGFGVVAGLSMGDDPPDQFLRFTAADKALILGCTGAISGAVVGLVVGLLSHGDRWVPVASPQRAVSLRLVPATRAHGTGLHVGVGMRVR